MTPLEKIIHAQINRFGPINIAEYMNLCLLHPEHGYYTTRQPLGAAGDFTTAPEISQMFGEMLGLCLIQAWQDQGAPKPFQLVELGPGRGTLMADILRVGARVPGLLEAADIWLVEASPSMREIQSQTLAAYRPNWITQITDLPDLPLFLIANEFFDALPIRQFQRAENGWQERMIGLTDGKLAFGLARQLPVQALEDQSQVTKPGQIVESNTSAQSLVGEIATRLKTQSGAALLIDYGNWGSNGATFQAVRNHQKVDPLSTPGKADLTAHVDFAALARAVTGVDHTGLTPQGVLLERLGITSRAQTLATKLAGAALENHIAAHRRLTHQDEMGTLFKALALYPVGAEPPPGFDLHEP
jgi:NADH dehydrogenase [ubiquinone] 1 alpha subcomplex assembly factor 7